MDRDNNFDLIVVGAGPAGLSTALHLIKKDRSWARRMLLLEKAVHPRPKLCGGGLTRFGIRILQSLDIDWPIPIPHTRIENVYLLYRNRKIHIRGKPQFIVFNRPDFDLFLVQQAGNRGIRVSEGETVLSLQHQSDSIRVVTDKNVYLPKLVVGADGSLGPVRKLLQEHKAATQVSRTIKTLTAASLNFPRFVENSAVFDFTGIQDDLQGYFWDFPVIINGGPQHNRGIYDSRLAGSRSRANLQELLEKGQISVGTACPTGTVNGYPIHWFSPENQISMDRVLSVGDSAGVDVLFGEGIGPALAYGDIAAEETIKAFEKKDFRFIHYRRHVMISFLGRYLFPRWILANALYRWGKKPLFMHFLWTVSQILATIWRAGRLYPDRELPNENGHQANFINE
jgi:flavin-dependent dehydrogenase